MKLIIGLGNPGKTYQRNRHNIGWRIIEAFGAMHGFEESTVGKKHKAETAEGELFGHKVMLVKPQTFMNLSGKSVASLVNFFKLNPSQDILVCHDDKDMLFGKLRERSEGGSGGHNGIKSITSSLGTEKFHRLKFGVGHEDQQIPTDAFVLQNFSKEEEDEELTDLIDESVVLIEKWLE